MSDVETLRKAAALMRERAQAATQGRWETHGDGWPGSTSWVRSDSGEEVVFSEYYRPTDGPDGVHIASWDPTVALLVADGLEAHADTVEAMSQFAGGPVPARPWLAVARAYLREEEA